MKLPTNIVHPLVIAAGLALGSCGEPEAPAISVREAWARPTAAGQANAAVYLTIANSGGEDRLVGVSSAAGEASLHETSMGNGVMRMRHLGTLDIPADSAVELKPAGTHIMLTGLKQPLEAGGSMSVDLQFERAGVQQVPVTIGQGPK